MQTAKEYREQLEWFWLFCQEEAWQEAHPPKWQLIKTVVSAPAGPDGRFYHTTYALHTVGDRDLCQNLADFHNATAEPEVYYSIRKVEN